MPENPRAVSGGQRTRFLQLPVNLVWTTFGEANGVHSLADMRGRISHYRRSSIAANENPTIGCIMLAEPFFSNQADWIPGPSDFKPYTVAGKGYDSDAGTGELWASIVERLRERLPEPPEAGTATAAVIESGGFGKPLIIHPRVGQGLFRILVAAAYSRRCAFPGEPTLPVLEAAHIKPQSLAMRHEVSNGLLLRAELGKLFDEGYLAVDPKGRRVAMGKRVKEELNSDQAGVFEIVE